MIPGTLVPRATNAMALTPSLRLMKQPRWPATSPMMAVQPPMKKMAMTNVGYPWAIAESKLHALVVFILDPVHLNESHWCKNRMKKSVFIWMQLFVKQNISKYNSCLNGII